MSSDLHAVISLSTVQCLKLCTKVSNSHNSHSERATKAILTASSKSIPMTRHLATSFDF